MADRTLPTPEELRNLLAYDPETGVLTWRERRRGTRRDQAGTENSQGYLQVGIWGGRYLNHRVAWAIAHGEWPQHTIDHINGITTDNRLSNLRDVPHAENHRNRSKNANNTSGCNGVYWCKRSQRWNMRVRVDGSLKNGGYFAEKFDAILARLLSERDLGYTTRHGRPLQSAAS